MADYTLSQIRALIDATVFPPSATNDQKNVLINKAREMIYMAPPLEGGGNALWQGTTTTATLPVTTQLIDAQGCTNQTVTLPRWLSTILQANDQNGVIDLRNEFTAFGYAGEWGGRLLSDLSNGFCGITNISINGATLKITTTANEAGGLTITFVGLDVNGNYLSETLAIPTVSGNSVATSNVFYSVKEVVKSVTAGYLPTVQVTSGIETPFARYSPAETFPNYRRYLFAFKTNLPTVNVKAKRCFHQLSADNDPVEFGSIRGMECALQAYRWWQNNDTKAYQTSLAEAIGYMNGDQAAYQSEGVHTVVQMQPEFSPGRIPNIL